MMNSSAVATSIFSTSGNTSITASDYSSAITSSDYSSAIRTLGICIGIFDIIVGVTGNTMTFLVILTNKKLHKPFYIFIANLSVIDFLTASLVIPFNVASYHQETWPFGEGDFSCSLMAYFYYVCGYTSVVCLIVISVNRYIGVVHSNLYDQLFTKTRIKLIIFLSWLLAPTFLLPFFFFSNGGFGWIHELTLCVFITNSYTPHEFNYMQFTRIMFQLLPVLVLVLLYTMIFLAAKRSGRAMRRWARTDSQTSSVKSESGIKRMVKTSPLFSRFATERKASSLRISKSTDINQNQNCDVTNNHTHGPKRNERIMELSTSPEFAMMKNERRGFRSAPATPETIRRSNFGRSLNTSKTVCFSTPAISSSQPPRSPKFRTQRTRTPMQEEAGKRRKVDRKLLRVSVTICVAFMILFLPSFIINLIPDPVAPWVHMFGSVISWFNSCVNPCIYCFLNSKMRNHYRQLISKFGKSVYRCFGCKPNDR